MALNVSKRILVALALAALAAVMVVPVGASDFDRWPVITLDGEGYYWVGVPDGPDGETDVPGHYWVQAGPGKLVTKHYNTGPFGVPKWWSSDVPGGALLYVAPLDGALQPVNSCCLTNVSLLDIFI
jgi:hypothetical protein